MSQVITFYSYKGGVGRSLALVNVATLLSKWGKKVLIIDWDLEAPGLENFFAPYLQEIDWSKQKGVLDFLWAKQKKESAPWQEWVLSFSTKISTTPLNLLVSGKSNGDYSDQLRAFNVSEFYKKYDGAHVIEDFRKELLATYDYILIDSRTGVTDFGGICTIQMPDILVILLTATEQGLNGTAKIAEKAQAAHAALPFDREKLLIMPVPSRIDQSEYALTQEWLNKIATRLKPYYEDWVPAQIDLNEFIRLIKLPYIPYFSYGEKLPVIEQGVSDPTGLGYAYENLAMLASRNLDNVNFFVENREKYLEEISGQTPNQAGTTIITSNPRVTIFISFAEEDINFRDELSALLESTETAFKVQVLGIEPLLLGQSKKRVLEQILERSDVVLILHSKSYQRRFMPNYEGLSILTEKEDTEYEVIEKSEQEFVTPIYLNGKNSKVPKFLKDRIGIPEGTEPQKISAKEVVKNLIPLLNTIYQYKKKEREEHQYFNAQFAL
ncbi:MAG: KGGVGR-motif variant AAA ATPase [Saprospiraceae bacterium]